MDKLKNLISQKDKKDIFLVGMFIAGVLSLTIYFLSNEEVSNKKESVNLRSEFTSGAEHGELKTYFTQQISKKLKESNSKVKSFEDRLESINKDKQSEIDKLQMTNADLASRLLELEKKSSENNTDNYPSSGLRAGNQGKIKYDPNMLPAAYDVGFKKTGGISENNQALMPEYDEIELITVDLSTKDDKPKFKSIDTYLPAGTHIRGVIVGGVEAHTEVYGNQNSRVATIRLVEKGNAPNGFKMNMKDCIVLASAWGNASSERVAMRGERISCVGNSGKVLETDLVATIYGPDGRQDVRGRMVYPEGKLLQRAFLAGSLSGIGSGLAQSFSQQSISPLGATSVIPNEDIFKFGAAQGAGKSLDKLADYYIKRAEQLQPVIQLGSGVPVDVVIQKGFYLDGKAHSESASNIPDSPFTESNPKHDAKAAANIALSKFEGVAR